MENVKLLKILRGSLGGYKFFHKVRFRRMRKWIPSIAKKYGCNLTENIIYQMEEAMVKYHWGVDEFFMYDYMHLTEEERKSFVPDYEKNIFCDRANNSTDELVFHDKWYTFQKFEEFYKRKVFLIRSKEDIQNKDVKSFMDNTPQFMIKPTVSSLGIGIKIISQEELENLEVNPNNPIIIEELIQQSSEMARFHPQSVNTIRITTMRCGNDVEIIHPFMKIGRGKQVVDNGGSGGILCAIDEGTGSIIAASDELLNRFDVHPDTKENIVGFKIPKWNEAIEMAIRLSKRIPTVRYVGWDMALTDEGWVLIEGNEKGQFVGWQLTLQKGFRQEFNDICRKANIKLVV